MVRDWSDDGRGVIVTSVGVQSRVCGLGGRERKRDWDLRPGRVQNNLGENTCGLRYTYPRL